MIFLFFETLVFNILMLILDGVNAVLELWENSIDYPSHNMNRHASQGRMKLKNIIVDYEFIKLRAPERKMVLSVAAFFCPSAVVFITRKRVFDIHFLANLTLLMSIYMAPISTLHALYLVWFAQGRSESRLETLNYTQGEQFGKHEASPASTLNMKIAESKESAT